MTERSSSSASFKSCILLRSRALIFSLTLFPWRVVFDFEGQFSREAEGLKNYGTAYVSILLSTCNSNFSNMFSKTYFIKCITLINYIFIQFIYVLWWLFISFCKMQNFHEFYFFLPFPYFIFYCNYFVLPMTFQVVLFLIELRLQFGSKRYLSSGRFSSDNALDEACGCGCCWK